MSTHTEKDLIIDVSISETSIALLENKILTGLFKEKNNIQFAVGDIYLAKVKKIMPGLNAAFLNVGYEKDAFLHYLDLGPQINSMSKYLNALLADNKATPAFHNFTPDPDINKNGKITEVISTGQLMLVQIAKEPISSKGPRLSSELSIPGRNLVLIPFSNKISISQKIASDEEKLRLKKLIKSIKPNNYGVIVRTAAKNKRVATLDEEIRGLVDRWESSLQNVKNLNAPQLFMGELNRSAAIVRDIFSPSFNNIFVNDSIIYHQIKSYIESIDPEKTKIVKLISNKTPIFEQFGVDKQIQTSFGKTVTFKSGAYLIIEHTEALHVIDVNSGNRSKKDQNQEVNALEVNMSAAEEIARQLKLRDMGGIIVIDFIDMLQSANRNALYEKMKFLMESDPAKHTILPLSKFGLMEITRQRVRPETDIDTVEKCPSCSGTGEIQSSIILVDEIENNLKYILKENPSLKEITLKVHPYLASHLTKNIFSIRYKWAKKNKISLKVKSVTSYAMLEYRFVDLNDRDILT
jgi:ribonuclease G